MKSAEITTLREKYAALLRIADGLLDMLRSGDACNIITFARMAEAARSAARAIASAIERIVIDVQPAPAKSRHGLMDVLRGAVSRIVGAIAGALAA